MSRRTPPQLDYLAARTAEIQAELDASPLIDRPTAHGRRSKRSKHKATANRRKGFAMLKRGRSVESISQLGDFAS
jgi:hypothetical protein